MLSHRFRVLPWDWFLNPSQAIWRATTRLIQVTREQSGKAWSLRKGSKVE